MPKTMPVERLTIRAHDLVCLCGRDLVATDVSPGIGQPLELELRHKADLRVRPCKLIDCPCGIETKTPITEDMDFAMSLSISKFWAKVKRQMKRNLQNGRPVRSVGAVRLMYEMNHIWYHHTYVPGREVDNTGIFQAILP